MLLEKLGIPKESAYEDAVNLDKDVDIRIIVYDPDSGGIVDDVLFTYELDDTQGNPQIIIMGFERINLIEG